MKSLDNHWFRRSDQIQGELFSDYDLFSTNL